MHQQRVAVENSPALKALCIRTRRSPNPCTAQHSVNFHAPCHALYLRPLSLSARTIAQARHSKSASHPCLFLDVLDTTKFSRNMQCSSVSV